jgi:small subunit ribosomal protein S7
MPRRGVVRRKRETLDPKYQDALVGRCINNLMQRGKKSLAERILYGAFTIIEERLNKEPLEIFRKAIENLKPQVEVKSRRVGGSTYQVPVEVRPERRVALALRWLISYSKQRSERTMREKLAGELLDAFNNRGAAAKKKDDTHRMAEANKAFAHYRW